MSFSPASPDLSPLLLGCLAHLDQEEAMLTAAVTSLSRIRAALVRHDLNDLAHALEAQGHTGQAADELTLSRTALRQRIADWLQVEPSEATLSTLMQHLPVSSRQLLERRRGRLRELATEVEQLNQNNVALVYHLLAFLQHFLMELTGDGASGLRYGPSGQRQDAVAGRLVHMRG